MALDVTDATFQQEVLESKTPVLAYFWASWCMPCKMLAPIVEEVSKEYEGKAKVCKVSIEDASLAASHYGIMSVPTVAVFKNGKIVETSSGALPKKDLVSKIQAHLT